MQISRKIVKYLLKHPPKNNEDVLRIKRKFCKQYNFDNPVTNTELLKELGNTRIMDKDAIYQLRSVLRKRKIRTLSGVAPIAVLTKAFKCPGKCAYCPDEAKMPKSYLSNEPAVMRAVLCKFDPYKQVRMRLRALKDNGHETDKLELIVMGGTWSYLSEKYQIWYLKECYRAANGSKNSEQLKTNQGLVELKKELYRQQKKNEKAKNRIVGLTLETRPDYINEQELLKMREYGCTRIEIGLQHVDDSILKLNKRGHNVDASIKATELMRAFGFKITYHLMLNLPGSDFSKDLDMFKLVYSDPRFQPDQVKIYPCVVAEGALIHKWWKQGKWKPYSTKDLINLIINIKKITPEWVRIIRVIRDIPEESIIAGNKITNLRQQIFKLMRDRNIKCGCIRCREAGHKNKISNFKFKISSLLIRKYKVSGGMEYFLSYESKNREILFAFCRLFLPDYKSGGGHIKEFKLFNKTAIIRELHTYGQMTPIKNKGMVQHRGLGKKLLAAAEEIAFRKGYKRMAVIAGVGVRQYYRSQGYRLQSTYMMKRL